ncbi:hypothetical protein AAG906_039754 [Vitis piasezkii]
MRRFLIENGGESLLGTIKIAVLPIAKVFTMSGSLIGLVVATIIRPPYPFFKFTVIHVGIGNIGNVPLVLLTALCRDQNNPFGDVDTCTQQGTAYISFGQWVGAIVLYTYVFQMLAPPPEGTFDLDEQHLPIKGCPKDGSPEQVPLLTQEVLSSDLNASKQGKIKDFLVYMYDKLKIKQILQPPIIASCFQSMSSKSPSHKMSYLLFQQVNMFLCENPTFEDPSIGNWCNSILKKLIFTPNAPLFFFTDSLIILGEAMIPCILLALGGNLVDGPGSSKLGLRTTTAIIFGRLVLVPPAGIGIMFRFVLLLQHSMPTSVLSESAAVLFWVHIFAIFSMAGWIVLYLHILF